MNEIIDEGTTGQAQATLAPELRVVMEQAPPVIVRPPRHYGKPIVALATAGALAFGGYEIAENIPNWAHSIEHAFSDFGNGVKDLFTHSPSKQGAVNGKAAVIPHTTTETLHGNTVCPSDISRFIGVHVTSYDTFLGITTDGAKVTDAIPVVQSMCGEHVPQTDFDVTWTDESKTQAKAVTIKVPQILPGIGYVNDNDPRICVKASDEITREELDADTQKYQKAEAAGKAPSCDIGLKEDWWTGGSSQKDQAVIEFSRKLANFAAMATPVENDKYQAAINAAKDHAVAEATTLAPKAEQTINPVSTELPGDYQQIVNGMLKAKESGALSTYTSLNFSEEIKKDKKGNIIEQTTYINVKGKWGGNKLNGKVTLPIALAPGQKDELNKQFAFGN